MSKKGTRAVFRSSVFERDRYRCRCCNKTGKDRQGGDGWKKFHKSHVNLVDLDAHHITPREDIPNGGYVKENGISLCPDCHIKAEACLKSENIGGFMPSDLYTLIGSSLEKATECSLKLQA